MPPLKRDEFIPFIDWNGDWTRIGTDWIITKQEKEKKDMEKLTKEEAIKMHRAMWSYIAAKSKAEKRVVRKEEAIEDLFPNYANKLKDDCFLCEYSYVQNGCKSHCKCTNVCPLYNPDENEFMNCLNGLYYKYQIARNTDDYEAMYIVAMKIATLPEVDKTSYVELVWDKLLEMYGSEKSRCLRTFTEFNASRYVWILGYEVVNALKNKCEYKLNAVTETEELFNIKVETDNKSKETIKLCKICEE